MKLWELVNEYKAIADDDMLDADSMMGMLEIIKGDIIEKSDNIVKLIKNFDAEAEKFGKEKERFAEIEERYMKKSARLKEYLYNSMNEAGLKDIPNDIFKIKIKGNGGVAPLVILEGVEIPKEYQKITVDIDTAKIREALKTQKLEFAEIGVRGTHLEIK